ncbi:fibronectin type III domain-containing protein [Vreelandella utahensis]|uniref:fibronectin type III domain-containing protein n=1 Tax=Vreelandella halophila TaxID=86177 RepID=UPI0009863EF6|nr:fibronectin type III domain-containing protein [Halomonas utahensis]
MVSGSAVLSWDAPAYRVNGDGLPDGHISHYVVLWGQDPEQLSNSTEVTCQDCQDMEYTVEDLSEGKWYFSVKTVDSEGRESARAEPASKTI